MKLLISKLNIKDFNENAYMKDIKNHENMNLINYNDFKKTNNDEILSDADYDMKYENENIKSDDDDLFIMSLLNNC